MEQRPASVKLKLKLIVRMRIRFLAGVGSFNSSNIVARHLDCLCKQCWLVREYVLGLSTIPSLENPFDFLRLCLSNYWDTRIGCLQEKV